MQALEGAGCRVIHRPPANVAPFRFTFETPAGERLGIMAYAFLANSKVTKNRPDDEHRFQVKYGSDDGSLHEVWQDPFGLYTTLFVGIDPERELFVGADPVLHNPTRFFMSVEFKQAQVDEIVKAGWHAWERERRTRGEESEPVEVLVGGTAKNFLRYVRFERDAFGEDQGHRQLLAEKLALAPQSVPPPSTSVLTPTPARLHDLAREFEMSEVEVLDLISSARRLKMAVRGWVAETHLVRFLGAVPGVTECSRSDEEGGPDVLLRFEGSRPISVECKERPPRADGCRPRSGRLPTDARVEKRPMLSVLQRNRLRRGGRLPPCGLGAMGLPVRAVHSPRAALEVPRKTVASRTVGRSMG